MAEKGRLSAPRGISINPRSRLLILITCRSDLGRHPMTRPSHQREKGDVTIVTEQREAPHHAIEEVQTLQISNAFLVLKSNWQKE